jgi:hypothetical protein
MTENLLPSEEVLHHAAAQLGRTWPGEPMQKAVKALSITELAEVKDILSYHAPEAGHDLSADLGPHATQAYQACKAELDRRRQQARTGRSSARPTGSAAKSRHSYGC